MWALPTIVPQRGDRGYLAQMALKAALQATGSLLVADQRERCHGLSLCTYLSSLTGINSLVSVSPPNRGLSYRRPSATHTRRSQANLYMTFVSWRRGVAA